jgi:predicted lipoprotein
MNMLEIKANKGRVKTAIDGDDVAEVLAELGLSVRVIIRIAAEEMKKNGAQEKDFAQLRTSMNLAMLECVAKGIEDAGKTPVKRGNVSHWEEES